MGQFRSVDDRLALTRPGGLPPEEETQIMSLFPGYDRFDHLELVADEARLRSAARCPLHAYLEQRDMAGLPLAWVELR